MRNFPIYNNNEIKYLQTEIPTFRKKMNLIFQIDYQGKIEKRNITFDYGTTIHQAFTRLLKTIGRPDLIGQNDKIYFIYSAIYLDFFDERRIEKVFTNKIPQIYVSINNQKNNVIAHQSCHGTIPNNLSDINSRLFHNNINQISLLNEEKEKNKILTKEIINLKQKVEFLNSENAYLKSLVANQNKSRNNYTMKNEFSFSQMKPGEKILAVNLVSMGVNDIGHYALICRNTDLFVRLEERLYNDFPQFKEYETFFNVNGRRIKRFKTIADNKIKTNDVISIFINES